MNNPRTIRQAVLGNTGIAVIPEWLARDCIKNGQVKVILKEFIPTPLYIHAVYPERRFVPARVRCFIDFIREKFETNNINL